MANYEYPILSVAPAVYRGKDIPASLLKTKSDIQAVEEGCYLDLIKASSRLKWLEENFGYRPYKWQADALLTYLAWRRADGGYRFSAIICFIGKKNGKTEGLAAPIIIVKQWELKDANIFSVAYNAKQASILLKAVARLYRRSPAVKQLIGKGHGQGQLNIYDTPGRREINNLVNGCTYTALANNIDGNDGIVGKVMVCDELHRMKNALYDVCAGFKSNMTDTLEVIISTAGSGDTQHRSFQKYDYANRIITGDVVDPLVLPIIYEYDKPDETDPKVIYDLGTLVSCNPILQEDVEKRLSAEKELVEAKELGNVNWWRRFRLNVWCVGSDEQYINRTLYDSCEDAIDYTTLNGCRAWLGFDKSHVRDLTAICVLIEYDSKIYERHIAVMPKGQLSTLSVADDIDYAKYVGTELLLCPGKTIRDDYLLNIFHGLKEQYRVQGVALDPYHADAIKHHLSDKGFTVYEVNQGLNKLHTQSITSYEEMLLDRRILHQKNELFAWQLCTCAAKTATSKNIYKIVKRGSNSSGKGGRGKIDGVDALVNALGFYRMEMMQPQPSVYTE